VAAFCFTHARSSAKKLALNQTAVINVTGKAFFSFGTLALLIQTAGISLSLRQIVCLED
jgi:hypothetical protein